jgi:hypothetical protein
LELINIIYEELPWAQYLTPPRISTNVFTNDPDKPQPSLIERIEFIDSSLQWFHVCLPTETQIGAGEFWFVLF